MGIFRFLGNKIGEAIEWVGNKTGSDFLTDVGIGIQVACNFGQSQWDANSTADDTAEVHKRLDQFKEQIAPQAQAKEQVLINQCVEKITKLLFLFQSVLSEVVQMPSAPLSDGLYIIVIQSQIRDIVVTVELVPKAVARIIYVFPHCCVLRLCI